VSLSARSVGGSVLGVALLALSLASPAAAVDRAEIRGSVPTYAKTQAPSERVSARRELSFQVVLGLRDRTGARALATRVSDPRRDAHREFVSAAEFRRRFSWGRDQITPVARWLRGRGMRVGEPTRNRVLLPVAGTAAEFERAFGTRLRSYSAFGQRLVAPSSPLRVPRSVAGMVRGTIGVPEAPLSPHLVGAATSSHDPTATRSAGQTADPGPPPLGFDGLVVEQPPPPNCSRYWAQQASAELPPAYGQIPLLAICGYSAAQIRSAYGARKLHRDGVDGTGVDVGIVTAYRSPTLQSDLDTYSDDNAIPRTRLRISRPASYTPTDPDKIWAAYSEQTLDVQVSHGMAPGARIHYVGPDGFNDAIRAEGELVDRNRVDVISNSWGVPEVAASRAYFRAAEDVFMQAAAQGITMLYSSGDTGDGIEEIGIRTVQYPGSSRWVTAVGATTLNVGPTGQRVWEQAWGESAAPLDQATGAWDPEPPGTYAGGSTGGASRVFRQPGYQRKTVPDGLSVYFGGHARVVPDVGLIGDPMSGPGLAQTAVDPTGAEVVTHHSVGGTSVASPVLAGAVAVIVDRNGGRLGFLNPSLYRAGARALRRVPPAPNPAVSAIVLYANFLDPSDGFAAGLLSGGQYGTLTVRRGYDDVTGLGSPSVPILARRLRRMSG
jgi:subtilase family serine protease